MIVFGGILEVTKELDDLMLFDIKNRKWIQLFEEVMLSPIKQKYGSLLSNNAMSNNITPSLSGRGNSAHFGFANPVMSTTSLQSIQKLPIKQNDYSSQQVTPTKRQSFFRLGGFGTGGGGI
jgi:hypothetical protein